MKKKATQQELRFRTWGGRRRRAGRKRDPRSGVPHRARPHPAKAHPVHVTLRAVRRLVSLRKQAVFLEVRKALGRTARAWFRIVHFSVQADHVHLLVEADDKSALTRGLMGAEIRIARAVNRVLGQARSASGAIATTRGRCDAAGSATRPRLRVDELEETPAERRGIDPCSSARWFKGWDVPPERPPDSAPVEVRRKRGCYARRMEASRCDRGRRAAEGIALARA